MINPSLILNTTASGAIYHLNREDPQRRYMAKRLNSYSAALGYVRIYTALCHTIRRAFRVLKNSLRTGGRQFPAVSVHGRREEIAMNRATPLFVGNSLGPLGPEGVRQLHPRKRGQSF